MNERVLIVEDDADMRDLLQEVLDEAGYETVVAADGRAALAHIKREREQLDLIITDVQMPGVKGDQVLRQVRESRPELPVIVITAFGSIEQAIELVKNGAFQYLTKPFQTADLLRTTAEALDKSFAARAQAKLRRDALATPLRIIGASRNMRELFDLIGRAAASASTLLITGESGTGKELVARAVHDASARAGAFVPVNCAAIPTELIESELFGHTGQAFTGARLSRAGLFVAADKGTIFLDEIAELPINIQPKLLRVLQEGTLRSVGSDRERTVNVRVIAATNRDLENEMRAGRFREDLYWRLNVIHLHVPPLRERRADIALLVEHFVNKSARLNGRAEALTLTPEALAVLTAYPFPGNVRELENTIERAVALARSNTQIGVEDLPERVRLSDGGGSAALVQRAGAQRLTLDALEREYILETLRHTGGNKSRAAELLGLDRKTLYRKLDEYRTADPTLEI